MCGGSRGRLRQGRAGDRGLCQAVAKRLGEAGSGQLTKMVNQICIAGIVQGMSEGLSFARAAGLDIEAVVEVISKGAAQSWQMENRHKTMAAGEYDHGFAVEWMRKDLGIVLEEARTQRRQPARHSAGGPVLCRSREHGRQALGYVQPVRAPGERAQGHQVIEVAFMNNERDETAAPLPKASAGRNYHHGDLRNGLLEAARTILEEESLAALTLRAVARKAGVSHAAPYRHFPNHEALLVELSRRRLRRAARGHQVEAAKALGDRSRPNRQYRRRLYALCGASGRRWRG